MIGARRLFIALLAICATSIAAAQVPPTPPQNIPPASLALVTTFATGKTTIALVSERQGRIWTAEYPKVDSWVPPDDTSRALQIARVRAGDAVQVTVSMLHGRGLSEEDVVSTLTLARGSRVIVSELTVHGAQPIELAVVDADVTIPFLPSATTIDANVEISRVDLLTAPYPGYRLTVRNLPPRRSGSSRSSPIGEASTC